MCSCGPSVGQKVFLNLCTVNLADFFLSFPTIQRKINCLSLNADSIIVCLENGINKKKKKLQKFYNALMLQGSVVKKIDRERHKRSWIELVWLLQRVGKDKSDASC